MHNLNPPFIRLANNCGIYVRVTHMLCEASVLGGPCINRKMQKAKNPCYCPYPHKVEGWLPSFGKEVHGLWAGSQNPPASFTKLDKPAIAAVCRWGNKLMNNGFPPFSIYSHLCKAVIA